MTEQTPSRPIARDSLRNDRRGVTSLEYALIASLIFLVIIGSLTTLGTSITRPLATVNATLTR